MYYLSEICWDSGLRKGVNQDAAMVRRAKTAKGEVLLAVVCDGMGGLKKGEQASSTVIHGMARWFEQVLPALIYHNYTEPAVRNHLRTVVTELNQQLWRYGRERGICLGTTMTALLLLGHTYSICNVGDSRIYCLDTELRRLTKDQSLLQRELDMGTITQEEAACCSQRNVLLQCIGASSVVEPDFYFGTCKEDSVFLLCSDGFWHLLRQGELEQVLRWNPPADRADWKKKLSHLVDRVKARGEEDNITAVLISVNNEPGR